MELILCQTLLGRRVFLFQQPYLVYRLNSFGTVLANLTNSGLSSVEFVGVVTDNPDQQIGLKIFYSRIENNQAASKKETQKSHYVRIVSSADKEKIEKIHLQIKQDGQDIVDSVREHVLYNLRYMNSEEARKKS